MNPALATYAALGVAISLEVIGTTLLQQTQQFTRPLPTIGMALCYAGAFYFLTFVLRSMPVGIAYAIWSGLGIVLISAIGFFLFRQTLDLAAIIGLGFIIVGVIIVNVFSSSVSH
ncbi:QacE family quaternary ammonium compound efflux SMR transporter [Kaistia sp. 32K]|uniref:DMT family transporter n=1 Tax=Kaistia sp. 32K TaxID=2795690 RepID=UPI001916AC0C|nr:multidrug efflux SMR transporter [Kaistia sp. 32K]BCP56355.1 QacE family quaternary ammonium compound efflux SMR transporter [Kaistia sp. 32K]